MGVCIGRIEDSMRNVIGGTYIVVSLKADWRCYVGLWIMRLGAWIAGFAGVKAEEE